MPGITHITSTSHFTSQLSTHIYVVADFYADWCGPCKAIAPTFSTLANTHSAAGKVAFSKIDVDAQPELARQHGVSAMPTFLIFKNGRVADTIRGANPAALKAAVERAARDAAGAKPASSTAFQSTGYTLGSASTPSRSTVAGGIFDSIARGLRTARTGTGAGRGGWVDTVVRFFGLYFTTLLSLDAGAAAEASPFSLKSKTR